ncbi:MAG: MoaD/ThiS family protein [Armatimonadota bacterium]
MDPDAIEVELLGVARVLARRETIPLSVPQPATLAGVGAALLGQAPALAGTVLHPDGTLRPGYAYSRAGKSLLHSPDEPVHPGDRLLLLSIIAGG